MTKARVWLTGWLALGGYSLIAAHGGGGALNAAMAMASGFMAARTMADMGMTKSETTKT